MTSELEATSLHRISRLPLDSDAEIFRHYPAFKLGVTASVRHYAGLLLPLLQRVMAGEPEQTGWIITAPPIMAQTPAGANLLCRGLFELYTHDQNRSNGPELSLVEIRHDSTTPSSIDWKDPAKAQDYAKLEFADRVSERERASRRLVDKGDFRGRPILFVNDICVTGAQQQVMQRYFDQAGAAGVKWIYLITVEPEIGRATPAIEWQINFTPFENLLRLVSCEPIQFTGKCVQRLMGLSVAELDQVLRGLDGERRSRLLQLAVWNGYQDLDGAQQQIEMVRSYAETGSYPAPVDVCEASGG
jgi:hypothetical protein